MSARSKFFMAAGASAAAVVGLIVWSLMGSTAYYRTPAELSASRPEPSERIRVAGTVVAGSVVRAGAVTTFAVSDGKAQVPVTTDAVLPDTFDPGVEVVVEGSMPATGAFSASTVLAKCPSKFKAKLEAGGSRAG